MEKGRNSYYGLAIRNLDHAEFSMEYARKYDDFNSVASLCAQSCEKFLKAVAEITCFGAPMETMTTHNLKKIIKTIKEYISTCTLSEKDYKWVGDHYFDARYPGDDFVVVSEEDAQECLRLTRMLKEWVDSVYDTPKDNSTLEPLNKFNL